jgi:hypothetical protein
MKREKSANGSQNKTTTIDINESQLSSDIPDVIKIGIADCVVAYAAMEDTAERLIWDISGLSYDDGRLLTRSGGDKFEILRKVIEGHGLIIPLSRQSTINMWTAIKQLTTVRNLIVHGVWAMLDNTTAISVSNKLASDHGHVEGEGFGLERLQAFVRQCLRVTAALQTVSDRVSASATKK